MDVGDYIKLAFINALGVNKISRSCVRVRIDSEVRSIQNNDIVFQFKYHWLFILNWKLQTFVLKNLIALLFRITKFPCKNRLLLPSTKVLVSLHY